MPTSSSAVDIFASPVSQEFAAVGSGGDLRIRYDAATNKYEVMAGNLGWTALVDDPLSSPIAGNPNQNFVFAGAATNQSFFMIRVHHGFSEPSVRYQYSNLAAWGHGPANVGGITAFGISTPTGSVPMTGSASYQGMIEGLSTVQFLYEGQPAAAGIGGGVSLNFNFGSGSLSGQIQPFLDAATRYDLPSLAFTNTVFGVGSTTFSGSFATNLSGPNSFSGQFTGPNAQELIGRWAFPFASPIDGAQASGAGAWIAKRP